MSPVSSRWAGACERWWLYWMSWTAASPTASCKGSQPLFEGVKRGMMQGREGGVFLSEQKSAHLALQSQPTPWCPRRQRWPGSAAWGGSVRSGGTPHRAGSSAAPIGCCWTAPAQSRGPPSRSLSAGLKRTPVKCGCWMMFEILQITRVRWERGLIYLLNYTACLWAF